MRDPLRAVWRAMKGRCHNVNNPQYSDYGARGITVCPRWRASFEAFVEDMGRPPFRGATLERVDNSIGYAPSNCRWATRLEQSRNKRNNRLWEHCGRAQLLVDWATEFNINYRTLVSRVYVQGLPLAEALQRPVASPGRHARRRQHDHR